MSESTTKNPDQTDSGTEGPNLPPGPQAQPGDPNYQPAKDGVIAAIAPAILETSGGDSHTALQTLKGAQADIDAKAAATGKALAGAAADLQSTVPKAETVQGEGQNIYGQGQGAAREALGLGNSMDAAEQTKGQADAAVVSAQQMGKANTNAAIAGQAAAVGLTGPDSTAALKSVHDNSAQLIDLTQQVADMRSVSFSDDPGTWLVNHVIKIPWVESQAEDTAKTLGLAQGAISKRSDALNAFNATDTAINSADTVKMAALKATQAQAAATVAGLTAQLQGHQQAIGAYSLSATGAGVTDAGISREQSGDSGVAGIDDAQFKLNTDAINAGYTSTIKDAAIQAATDRSKLAAAQLDKDLAQNKNLDLLQSAAGAALDSVGILHDKDLTLPLKQMAPMQRQAILNIGAASATTGGALGNSPGEIYRNLVNSKLPLDNMPPGQKIGFDEIGKVYQAAVAEVRSPAFKARNGSVPPGSEAENNIIDGFVTSQLQQQQKLIQPGVGIYGTPSINSLLTQKDSSGNLVNVNNDVLNSMVPMTMDGSGGTITKAGNFNDVINSANMLVQSGKLTEAKAAQQVAAIAQSAQQASNEAIGYKKFQIPLENSYKVQLKTGQLGGYQTYDMKNEAQVLTALRMSRAAANASRIMGGNAVPGGY